MYAENISDAPSMSAAFLALLGILFVVLATWELRRPLRLVRTRVLPALRAIWLRRMSRRFSACGTSRDLEHGKLARVVGTVVDDRGERAFGHVALSQLTVWGEFGERIEERTDGENFSLRLGDGEVVRVAALDAAKTDRLRLLDGKSEERYGAGFSCRRRQITVGQVAAASGRVRRVLDDKVTSPHPRIAPTAWQLAADSFPLIVQGSERTTGRSRLQPRADLSGRILAMPAFMVSFLLLSMSAPTAIGVRGLFALLGYLGVSGVVFSVFVAIVGAPGTLRTWSRWFLVSAFLAASVAGFWFGALID